ncbi:hypothetical protein [Metallibacterium scheffleri]|uniref:hypothetical protein n=1 Tax=Metallibacterium scheffleri TaxID=993689 RepID=UPI00109FFE32|nr:hypothetical protein [Metallibacterium scheffleri]
MNNNEQTGPRQDLAKWAPRSIHSEREARERVEQAERRWWTECREATVRAHEQGYVVVLGTGRHSRHASAHATHQEAEQAAVEAVRSARHLALGIIRAKILRGWDGATPFMGATLDTAAQSIPIHIRRAPCSNDELGMDAEGYTNEPPVVAIYRGESVEHPDVQITWDDERSRSELASRYESGMQRKQAEVAAALRQFAQKTATADLVMDTRMKCREVTTADGEHVVILGPVRLDHSGNAEARAALPDGARVWLPVSAF